MRLRKSASSSSGTSIVNGRISAAVSTVSLITTSGDGGADSGSATSYDPTPACQGKHQRHQTDTSAPPVEPGRAKTPSNRERRSACGGVTREHPDHSRPLRAKSSRHPLNLRAIDTGRGFSPTDSWGDDSWETGSARESPAVRGFHGPGRTRTSDLRIMSPLL